MTTYYTYCSYETDKGTKSLYYIGSRKCPEGKTPETDNYFGTPSSPENKEFKDNPNKDKVILGVFNSKEEALAHEIWLHDLHDVGSNPTFANQAKQTSTKFSMGGRFPSEETRKKISESMRGRKRSESTRKKMAESARKRRGTFSEETKAKLREIARNRKFSEETLAKMSEASSGSKNPMFGKVGENNPNFGKNHKPEAIQKISESKMGEKNPSFDHTLYNFENIELGITEIQVTRYYLQHKYGLGRGGLGSLVKGKSSQHKGWTLIP